MIAFVTLNVYHVQKYDFFPPLISSSKRRPQKFNCWNFPANVRSNQSNIKQPELDLDKCLLANHVALLYSSVKQLAS